LFLNEEIFNFYGHLGGFFNVKLVSQEVLDAFPTSGLFRNCEANDPKVYGVNVDGEDTGTLSWVDVTGAQAVYQDPNFFSKVFCVNDKEFKWYPKASAFHSLNDVPKYQREKAKATQTTAQKIKDHEKEYKKKHGKEREDENDDDDFYKRNVKNIGKILVCHNEHTILISPFALPAHVAHGDNLGKCGETTPNPDDTTAPAISSVAAGSITQTGAHITWTTDEASDSRVWYSTTTPVTATSTTSSISSSSLVTSHDISLTGLTASTTYYFLVESSDASSNKATSAEASFTTTSTPPVDTTAPVISSVTSTSTTDVSTHITWTTDENANSKVWYSSTTPVTATSTTDSVSSATLATSHDLAITGLTASTTYYFLVESSDASSNKATSSEGSFTTLPTPDTTAPVISSVSATSTAATIADITWTTDEASDSVVWYSTTTPVDTNTASSTSSNTLTTSHSVSLTGLTASTTYYFIVESTDAASNKGTSAEGSFTTPAL